MTLTKTGMSSYRIDLLDSSNNKLDVIRNVLRVDYVRKLDSIPTLSFVVFGNDPKAYKIGNPALATPALRFDVYHAVDGYLGRFYLSDVDLDDSDGRLVKIVNCQNELQALQDTISGFAREYSNTAIETIVTNLLSSASWTLATVTTGFNSSVTYQGQNLYEAISELLKRWNLHFRLTTTTSQLEIGAFGTINTNVRLTHLRGQGTQDASIGIVSDLSYRVDYKGIYNRIVAVGAGTGSGMLTLLSGQVGSTYTVQSRSKANGQDEYYIQDSTSITAYGAREIVVIFDQIRPIANTATAKSQAQSELLANAEAFLTRYKDPREIFDNVTVEGLNTDIKVGDKVNLRYIRKNDDGDAIFNIDSDVWVVEHHKTRTATGENTSRLKLSDTDRRDLSDVEIMASTVKAVRSEKLWVKPQPFRLSDTYIDFIQNGNGNYQDKYAQFSITFDDTVTEVTRVILEWKTKPLYTLSVWVDSAGAVTGVNNTPGDPHTHNLLGYNDGFYQVVESNDYPADVSIYLISPTDGTINITNHASVDYISGGNGIWNNGGINAALAVKMDITDIILGDSGGIYQKFVVELRCGVARTRDVSVPFWSNTTPINQAEGNHGIVEMKVITQGIAQSIYKA